MIQKLKNGVILNIQNLLLLKFNAILDYEGRKMSISNLTKGKKPKPLESFQLNKISKIFLLAIYHLIHKNIFFGFIHKRFIKKFKYKNFCFSLRDIKLPMSSYACFLFKTYEINDRVLVEKHITKKNKSIIIGGGIGFIGTIAYFLSKNKILVFEINKEIINTLKENLIQNKVLFECIEMNLVLKHIEKKYYYPGDNFLGTSAYVKQDEKLPMNNVLFFVISMAGCHIHTATKPFFRSNDKSSIEMNGRNFRIFHMSYNRNTRSPVLPFFFCA